MDPNPRTDDPVRTDWGLPPTPRRRPPGGAATVAPDPVSAAPPEATVEAAERRARLRRWFGLVVIASSQLMIVVDSTIVNVALPAMAEGLGIATADRAWVITAYTLAFAGLLLLGGRVADYLGRRRALVIGLIGFAAASGLAGAATDLTTLLVARTAQGAFGALLAPAALALLTTTFRDPGERAKAFAVFGMVAGGGSAVGLLAGGVLTEYASWRWTMFVNVPFALLAVAGAYLLLDESRVDSPGRLDLIGVALGSGGLVAIVYSFSEAERNGWTENLTLTLIGVGLSLLILFVVSQRMVPNPLLPLRVLADRTRAGSNLAILLASLGLIGAFFFLTFYMQEVLGYAPLKTGMAFLPVTAGVIIASAVISNVMTKLPPRVLMGSGLFGAAVAMFALAGMSADSDYLADLLAPMMLLGISLGAVFVPAFNAATHGVDGRDAGVASAVVNTAQNIGVSLGVALLSSVAANQTARWLADRGTDADTLTEGLVSGYARASVVAGAILLGAAILTVGLVNVRRLSAHGAGEAAAPERVERGTAAEQAGPTGTAVREAEVIEMDVAKPTPNGNGGHPPDGRAPVSAQRPGSAGEPIVLGVLVRTTELAPVHGAAVALLDYAGRQVARTETDAGGRAEFAVPARGGYLVVVSSAGTLPSAVTVPWPATREVEIRLAGASRLVGRVSSTRGAGVADALVTLTGPDGTVAASGRTDADGEYELVDLTIDSGTVSVFAGSASPVAAEVRLPVGERTRHDVEIRGTAVVSGVAQTPQGWLIADARVSLLSPTGEEIALTRTDGEGRYRFEEVDEGDYTLVAVGYPPASARIEVTSGETAPPPITLAHVEDALGVGERG